MSTILSVSQLTSAIKNRLEPAFSNVQVRGEITNFKEQSSGHLYFSLKDETSQISAVLFRGSAMKLERIPKSGDQVIVQGELSVYAPRGSYQLIIREMQFAGIGQLLLLLHQRKEKLEKMGYFDPKHKKPLPKFPKTIGVITSPTGSVIQDILQVLQRRFKGFHLILSPVRVQGDEAAKEIAAAIHEMNVLALVDVMIVGRGGGSLEDLWPFNEECVAQAIFDSKIPIISAVGHETDVTIADFVADVRAPTPSAAAEICMGEKKIQLERLSNARGTIDLALKRLLERKKLKLNQVATQPIFRSPYALLGLPMQKFDDMAGRLDQSMGHAIKGKREQLQTLWRSLRTMSPTQQLVRQKERWGQISQRLDSLIKDKLTRHRRELTRVIQILEAKNPKNILKQGFCIPFTEKTGSVIMETSQIGCGDRLRLLFHDGEIISLVDSITRDIDGK